VSPICRKWKGSGPKAKDGSMLKVKVDHCFQILSALGCSICFRVAKGRQQGAEGDKLGIGRSPLELLESNQVLCWNQSIEKIRAKQERMVVGLGSAEVAMGGPTAQIFIANYPQDFILND